MIKEHEKKNVQMKESTDKMITKSRVDFQKQLREKDDEVAKREKAAETRIKAIEEVLKQTEEDADKEILELKTRYERALRSERESNVRLRGESGVMKKKFQSAVKDSEDHRSNIQRMSGDNQVKLSNHVIR